MLDETSQSELSTVSRTLTVIIFAMCSGVTLFGVYVFAVYQPNEEREPGMLTYLAFGFAVLQFVLSFFLPRAITGANRKRVAAGQWRSQTKGVTPETDAGKLAAGYQTATFVSASLQEGAAFLALVAYMLEGHFTALVAAVVMFACILSQIPIGGRLTSWVEQELRLLNDERSAANSR